MAGKKNKKQPAKKKKHPGQPPAGQTVLAWEDDPQGYTPVSVPTPDPAEKPLAFRFPTPAPTAGQYPLGTASFRSRHPVGSAGRITAQRGTHADEGTLVSQLTPVPARRATGYSHPGAGTGCGGS